MTRRGTRLVAILGLAAAQLRQRPGRTALAVLAVALAVLSVTLFVSLGVGVVSVGQESVADTNRDVWISSTAVGGEGIENSIVDSHRVAADVTRHDDVAVAAPVGVYTAYVGASEDELQPITSVGLPRTHGGFEFEEGSGFDVDEAAVESSIDPSPSIVEPTALDGARSDPTGVVLDPSLAAELSVGAGDTIYVGPGPDGAGARAVSVVGTADRYSEFVGQPTMVMRLHELQGLVGARGADRAAFVTADLEPGADPEAVSDDLGADYPAYDVRTGEEQFRSMLADRSLVIVSAAALVGLAIVGGIGLTVNCFVLVAYQQRTELAALRAIGLARPVLAGLVGMQGLLIGLLGGAVALVATGPLVGRLNEFVASLVGFDGLLQTPPTVYAAGALVAVGVGGATALVAGFSASRYASVDRLESGG
ncbi:ABC transporter permease [Halovivax limisalsi]|uniref:ABC transporter permease n=1 Tax=Halovivax limisalsi TaxID=1453760 RepID=UPI001FFD085B|nr:ABC transporter permease [Halovivax limisalsi]